MDHNDFVFIKGADGKMYGGGYCIDNILMKTGGSPIITLNNNQSGGGGINEDDQFANIFKSYAVPSFLFSFPYRGGSTNLRGDEDKTELLEDELHKKLVDLVTEKNIKGGKKTRKTKLKISKSKSKKNI